jgi:hypothetical protein
MVIFLRIERSFSRRVFSLTQAALPRCAAVAYSHRELEANMESGVDKVKLTHYAHGSG